MKKVNSITVSLLIMCLVLFSVPNLAFAQTFTLNCSNLANLGSVATCLLDLIDIGIYFIMTFAFIYVIYGALRFIAAEGSARDEWRRVMTYGIITLFIMFSVWGIINLLTATFRFNNNAPPTMQPIRINTTG